MHHEYGHYVGKLVGTYLENHQVPTPYLIGWHGHTIFHDPQLQATCQVGDGATLAAVTGIHVVSQFRSIDVALGGQGAPLAPLADKHLMPEASCYLNLGGISNISYYDPLDNHTSFDVSPCNQILNLLANQLGLPYDDMGTQAAKGQIISDLGFDLDSLPFYQLSPPKSIDNNWIRNTVWPLIENAEGTIQDKLATCVDHIGNQIAFAILNSGVVLPSMIITGGGAYNTFLIEKIQSKAPKTQIIIPDNDLIQFKESALMGLMAFLFSQGINNVCHNVTGSKLDHVGGCLFCAPGKTWTSHG